MSREATLKVGLTIRKADDGISLLDYRRSAGFTVDVTGTKGPCIGSVEVTTDGRYIDLIEIGTPGLGWISNQSADYTIKMGIKDPQTNLFYPLLRIRPGCSYPIDFADDLLEEYYTGTGTGPPTNYLWVQAFGGTANLLIEMFEQ